MLSPHPNERTEKDLWMGFTKPFHNKYHTGGLQHLFARHIQEEVGQETFWQYHRFSVIRNPWDKAVSQFFYTQTRPDLQFFLGLTAPFTFIEYLNAILTKEHVQWLPQIAFITDDDKQCLVNTLLRFEHFSSEVPPFLSALGLVQKPLLHENATQRKHYRHYYDDVSINMVADYYKDDISLFGYTF